MASGVNVPLERRLLPVLRDGRSGIVAVFATIPGEDQDGPSGLGWSRVRMPAVTAGSDTFHHQCTADTTAFISKFRLSPFTYFPAISYKLGGPRFVQPLF